jgi:hypothetical protein
MDVRETVEKNRRIRVVVSAFVVLALASFCLPSLQTLNNSTDSGQLQEQFNHTGKLNVCIFAKAPAKISIRKGSPQQPVQFFYSAGDVSLQGLNFFARSICVATIHPGIVRGSLTLRERAPPV